MLESRSLGLAPAHARFAAGYACTCSWAVILLFSAAFGAPSAVHAASTSMLPGLAACLGSIAWFRSFPSLAGRTPFAILAGLFVAAGTLLCTHPAFTALAALRIAGLALSGFFAIFVVMAWFETFVELAPRAIIVLAGCALSIAACLCWIVLACPAPVASLLACALPIASSLLLPKRDAQTSPETDRRAAHDAAARSRSHSMREVLAAAVPARTLLGLAVTFFIVRSIATLAPEFEPFGAAVSPVSLLIPLAVTAFFVGSALVVKRRIDPSILYKIILSCFAGCVFLLASSTGVTAALVFYADLVAEVMMWTVLALWAKKTPVQPHLVFAIGWIAECAGNTLGQAAGPLFAEHGQLFFAVAIMLILIAVGFAFSEGQLMLDVDFEDEDRLSCQEGMPDATGGDAKRPGTNAAETGERNPAPAAGDGRRAAERAETHAGRACTTADGGTGGTACVATTGGGAESAAAGGRAQDADACEVDGNDRPGKVSAEEAESDGTPMPTDTPGRDASHAREGAPAAAHPATGAPGSAAGPDNGRDPLEAFAAAYEISPRERDVLALWLAGRGMKYIENELFISESTVKSHLRSIYRKCDTHNRDETISLFEHATRTNV